MIVQAADNKKAAADIKFEATDRWWKLATLMEEVAATLPTQSRTMKNFWTEWAGPLKTRMAELGFQLRRA